MTKPRRNPRPTRAQVRQLLAHAPRILALEQPVTNATSDEMPVYADWWRAFIEVAIQDHFMGWHYELSVARAWLEDRERLARASFGEWSAVFTFFMRGERFCDGFWVAKIERGCTAAHLIRLEQLERNWDGAA